MGNRRESRLSTQIEIRAKYSEQTEGWRDSLWQMFTRSNDVKCQEWKAFLHHAGNANPSSFIIQPHLAWPFILNANPALFREISHLHLSCDCRRSERVTATSHISCSSTHVGDQPFARCSLQLGWFLIQSETEAWR